MSNERAAVLIAVSLVVVYALVAMMSWVIRTFSCAFREMEAERRRGAVEPALGEDD